MTRRVVIGLLACAILVQPALAQAPAQDFSDWDDKPVEECIQKLKDYLWTQWNGGNFGTAVDRGHPGGGTALCIYALLAAGESPQNPKVVQTLDYLAGLNPDHTYVRGMRANAFANTGRDSKYRIKLREDVDWLVKHADPHGGYDYPPKIYKFTSIGQGAAPRYDNSNTQLAVLGVWCGVMNAVEVPDAYWALEEYHWKRDQNADGGWGYQEKVPSYGSMSVAGLATMFIIFDNLYYKNFKECKGNVPYPPIDKGLEWLDKNFQPNVNPGKGGEWYHYYMYGVERVGLASGYKYFGQKDWFKMGATSIMAQPGIGDPANAAFALLFLARGQHPILFNKLKYNGSWNNRPRDVANLTRWITSSFETTVNWQIIHLGVPVTEMHDAPILYISGSTAPDFTPADLDKLKEFVQQGGVIFSEAACSQAAFTQAMQKAYAKMFPAYELRRLPDDHPIYNLHFKVTGGCGLSAVSNGVRLLAIHSPNEVSLAWQMNNYSTNANVFETAANMYFFVTDKGQLRKRGTSNWPPDRQFAAAETVQIARLQYGGNWDPEPLALKRFALLMGNKHRVKVEIGAPVTAAQLNPANCPVVVMSGTGSFELAAAEKAAIRAFLAGGGTLIADSAGGGDDFMTSAEKNFKEILPDAKFGPMPLSHPMFTGVGPVVEKVAYRRALAMSVMDPAKPRLRAFTDGKNRAAIILSPDDLTAGLVGYPCWGLKGYNPDSAFAIMRNAVLYGSGKMASADEKANPAGAPLVKDW